MVMNGLVKALTLTLVGWTACLASGATVSIPETSANSGDQVQVPLLIDDASGVSGFQVTVKYDAGVLKATTVAAGRLTTGWMVTANTETPGEIRLMGLDASLRGLAKGSGELAVLKFKAIVTGPASIEIREVKLADRGAKAIPVSPTAKTTAAQDLNSETGQSVVETVPQDNAAETGTLPCALLTVLGISVALLLGFAGLGVRPRTRRLFAIIVLCLVGVQANGATSPSLVSPDNGSFVSGVWAHFVWNSPPQSGQYIWELGFDPDFTSSTWAGCPGLSYDYTNFANDGTQFWWRVWIKTSPEGPWQAQSPTWTFVNGPALSAPALRLPDNGSNVDSTTINFYWDREDGADGYAVQLSQDNFTSYAEYIVSDSLLGLAFPNGVPTQYWWRVRPFRGLSDWRCWGPFSGIRTFWNGRTVATPVFGPSGGTYPPLAAPADDNVTVRVTCATSDVTMRYIVLRPGDPDREPTLSDLVPPGDNISLDNITLKVSCTLKVKAFKNGWFPSATQSAVYTFIASRPVFAPDNSTSRPTGQAVTITSQTPGAQIRYTTDGSTPTETSALLTGAVTLDHSLTLKAAAFKDGWSSSAVQSLDYTITNSVPAPTFTPDGGLFIVPGQQVTVTCPDHASDVKLRYTTTGLDPTPTSGTLVDNYTATVSITDTCTLKAIAFKSVAGSIYSRVKSASFTLARGVSIPRINGIEGAVVRVPIYIDNASGVAGFQFTVTNNSSVLQTSADAVAGSLTSGWIIQTNRSTPGTTVIQGVASNLTDNSSRGPGSLAALVFIVTGTVGGSTPITLTQCRLMDKDGVEIPSLTGNGNLTVVNNGVVTITIKPDAAVTAGAQWNVDGGSWQNTGMVVEGAEGAHTVSFRNTILGWCAPQDIATTLNRGQTASYVANYIGKGDVNYGAANPGGEINVLDVILAMRMSLQLDVAVDGQSYSAPYPVWLSSRADMPDTTTNGNGVLDIYDVVRTMRKALRLDP